MPTFGRADTFYDTIGFETGKMFLYSLGGNANFLGKSCRTQPAIFGEQCDDFIPTFCWFSPTFLNFLPTFSAKIILFSLLFAVFTQYYPK